MPPLLEAGVPPELARSTIANIADSPALAAARRHDRDRKRLTAVARLHETRAPTPTSIDRIEAPEAATFFARHWSRATPVVFTDIVPRWRHQWTPTYLREHFGHAEIEACTDREGQQKPDANWRQHRKTLSLADYIDRMDGLGQERSNDLYLIANNRNTARPELRPLWDDVVLPAGWFDTSRLPFGSALWLGPAGTLTPLHHDTSTILFCQIYGRKRITLVPPWCAALLDSADGVYNHRRGDQLTAEGIEAQEITVEPGDALLLPLGWWHEVLALDASVSLAINAFAADNDCDWYRPGSIR